MKMEMLKSPPSIVNPKRFETQITQLSSRARPASRNKAQKHEGSGHGGAPPHPRKEFPGNTPGFKISTAVFCGLAVSRSGIQTTS